MTDETLHIYSDGETEFHGRLIRAAGGSGAGVLIAPAFRGLGPFEIARGHELAALGYTVLAVDYYGQGKLARDEAEAAALMAGLNGDRVRLARHLRAALAALAAVPGVDPGRIGAIGYCFGGKAVLDLARSGAALAAVAPIHGVYDPPPGPRRAMTAAALVLHGWDDPLCPPEAVQALAAELTETCPDWQILAFGHTGHAFTNPAAQNRAGGIAHEPRAAARSWRALAAFLAETLRP